MSAHRKKAFKMMEAARPASGFRPETPEEWARLQAALEELGYAMYRDNGMSSKEARCLAKQIHSGPIGLLLLEIGFREDSHD
jgi:hypothetical protein